MLPTDGVTSLRIDLGERSFWLSYTANEPAEPAWIKPEELI
jgi:hypothetical protein